MSAIIVEMHLPEQAGICLKCACETGQNRLARLLLVRAGAQTTLGVDAALFIATGEERQQLLLLARGAIAVQRDSCLREGLFDSERCPDVVRQKVRDVADH